MIQLSQRPLSASRLDGELFVDREKELAQIHRNLLLHQNVLLSGDRGSGRTSLLWRLKAELENTVAVAAPKRDLVVFADAGWVSSVAEAVATVRTAADRVFEIEPAERQAAPMDVAINRMAEAVGEDAIVLLDGLAPDVAAELFGRFRDALWEHRIRWVVTADEARRSEYLRPPADAFFRVVPMAPLSAEDAGRLLLRRADAAGASDDVDRLRAIAERIAASGEARTPRDVLVLAMRAMESFPRTDPLDDLFAMREEARQLGATAERVFNVLEEFGPLHAGDERLVTRVGRTRSRVVQVLKDLEAAELVVARNEGRRRLYEVHVPEPAP